MEPTLYVGDRVLVLRFTYARGNLERGDVVVFHPPGRGDDIVAGAKTASNVHFIKRVIGLPGDTIEMRRGRVVICVRPRVGCHALNEPYARTTADRFAPRLIPEGHYFVIGDNRDNSEDSRISGTVPRSSIVGEASWSTGRRSASAAGSWSTEPMLARALIPRPAATWQPNDTRSSTWS